MLTELVSSDQTIVGAENSLILQVVPGPKAWYIENKWPLG